MKVCTKGLCDTRRVGGQTRKWSDEVGGGTEKRRAFEVWLIRIFYRYRAQRCVVKQAVKVSKKMADER